MSAAHNVPVVDLSISQSMPRASRLIVDTSSLYLRVQDGHRQEQIVLDHWREHHTELGYEANVWHGVDHRESFIRRRAHRDRAFTTHLHWIELQERIEVLSALTAHTREEDELLAAQMDLLRIYGSNARFFEEFTDDNTHVANMFEAVQHALSRYANGRVRFSTRPGKVDISLLASAITLAHIEPGDTVGFATDDVGLRELARVAPKACTAMPKRYRPQFKDNLWVYAGLSGDREKLWPGKPKMRYSSTKKARSRSRCIYKSP